MTTFIDFVPSTAAPFQFQATLDGTIYTVIVTWSLFGKRYYIQILTLQGIVIVYKAMVGSPPDYDISLTWGYFTSTMIFRMASNQFEITP
jgi:hypothetical protein